MVRSGLDFFIFSIQVLNELLEATTYAKQGLASIQLAEKLQKKISAAESIDISSDQLQESYDTLENLKEKLKQEVKCLSLCMFSLLVNLESTCKMY